MRLPDSLSLSLAEVGGHRVPQGIVLHAVTGQYSDASHVSTIREASVCILSNRVTYLLLKTINVKISDAMCHDKNWLVQNRCNSYVHLAMELSFFCTNQTIYASDVIVLFWLC